MTLLGKILVVVNVGLSFLMLSFAFAMFTNRVDFTAKPVKGDKPAGVLAARVERVKSASESVDLANARWREALRGGGADKRPIREGLLAWDKRRVEDRAWYDEELKKVISGPGPDGKGDKVVVKRVATGKDGLPIPDDKNFGRPTLVDAERRKGEMDPRGEPLFCYDWYVRELGDLTVKIQAAQAEYKKAVEEETALTEEIIGTKMAKGLRRRIIDEQEKIQLIDEELKDVAGRQTNALVETELLLARRSQLERRIDELKRAAQEVKD
jgi:hypothetical protein